MTKKELIERYYKSKENFLKANEEITKYDRELYFKYSNKKDFIEGARSISFANNDELYHYDSLVKSKELCSVIMNAYARMFIEGEYDE